MISASAVPRFPDVFSLMQKYFAALVSKTEGYVKPHLDIDASVGAGPFALMAEAQTSGGLLAAVQEDQADELVAALRENGDVDAASIGKVIARDEKMRNGDIYLRVTV